MTTRQLVDFSWLPGGWWHHGAHRRTGGGGRSQWGRGRHGGLRRQRFAQGHQVGPQRCGSFLLGFAEKKRWIYGDWPWKTEDLWDFSYETRDSMELTGIQWIETVLSKLGPRNRGLRFQRVTNHLPTGMFLGGQGIGMHNSYIFL